MTTWGIVTPPNASAVEPPTAFSLSTITFNFYRLSPPHPNYTHPSNFDACLIMEVPQAPDAQLEIPPLPNDAFPFTLPSVSSIHPVLRTNPHILNNAIPRVHLTIEKGDPLGPLGMKEEEEMLIAIKGAQSKPLFCHFILWNLQFAQRPSPRMLRMKWWLPLRSMYTLSLMVVS